MATVELSELRRLVPAYVYYVYNARMSEPERRRRRWWQFSLRSLFVLVTLVIGALIALRLYLARFDAQRETMALIKDLGGRYQAEPGGPAWLRSLMGEQRLMNITAADVADCDQPQRYMDRLAQLPQLESLIVGGPNFTDRELRRLKDLPQLKILVLDTTEVTDEGLAELKSALPNLLTTKSNRLAIAVLRARASFQRTRKVKHPRLRGFAKSFGGGYFTDVPHAQFIGDNISQDQVSLLEHFPELEVLFMSNCFQRDSTTELVLRQVPQLTNLRRLDLYGANVEDSDLPRLRGLTKLKSLSLFACPITDAGLTELQRLKNLSSLTVSGSGITDAGLAQLINMKGLSSLGIPNTGVSDNGLAGLEDMPNLTVLNLDDTAISDAGVRHLIELPALQVLGVKRTKLTDAGVAQLAELKTLNRVHLDGTRITGSGLADFGAGGLSVLSLVKTNVGDAELQHVGSIKTLTWLSLSDNPRITDEGLDHLTSLGALTQLDLTGTNVTKAGVARFRKALPGLRSVIWPTNPWISRP